VALSLALTLLALGDSEAAALLASLAERHDVQEVWLGLAAAQRRNGAFSAAAAALAQGLSWHALVDPAPLRALADDVARRVGAPGWCGLQRDGTLLLGGGIARAQVEVAVDGAALRGRRAPLQAREVAVTRAGSHLLGSPIAAWRHRRVEGVVAVRDGVLDGWAWHPGDATRDPVLRIVPLAGGKPRTLTATDMDMPTPRPLARPRRFTLAGIGGPVRVLGADGCDLAGSPLDPGLEARAAAEAARAVARALPLRGTARTRAVPWYPTPAGQAGPAAEAPRRPRRPVAVVVPVYRDCAATLACLDAVFATVPAGTTVVVVDDATPEPELAAALDRLARAGRLRLLRHACNLGFPRAANAGLRAAAALPGAPDVVLLNSDTLPAPGWLEALRRAVHSSGDIGTASPLSNDATILTYPDPLRPGPPPADLAALGALAASANPGTVVDIPTAVGFCMYVRHECLAATGLLRPDVFGQGYGEENDFSIRARHLGWRHVAVPGAFVAHLGGRSFGDARAALLARNLEVLERLHPGYAALIAGWQGRDPLAPARRALDRARWDAMRDTRQSVLLVTHDHKGGVERAVRARCTALAQAGLRPILLRPVVDLSGSEAALERRYLPNLCAVSDGTDGTFPNLRFVIPRELPDLADLLRTARPLRMEVHHRLGHHASVLELAGRLNIPYEVRVHDYALFCPRVSLVGPDGRYCGEPDVSFCTACVADAGSDLEEAIAPVELRARSAAELAAAARVVVPSRDAAARLRRHFPAVRPVVEPHEDDADLPPLRPLPAPPRRVGVIGAIGVHKGYDVLLACARDAARRDLPLHFTVIGYTHDDARALATGRIFVTGPYRETDLPDLLEEAGVHLAFLPSVWPETWCYTLGEALRAGLAVAAFDIGAQAERIRRTRRGWLLPLGLPPPAINNALLAMRLVAGDECAAMTTTR
jgi:GT2 family glycosyltransferase/glycosyltransferase involved in cell wall biosynthesis